MEQIKRFFKEEEGLEMTEYAVMAALIIAAATGIITLLGGDIAARFQQLRDAITAG